MITLTYNTAGLAPFAFAGVSDPTDRPCFDCSMLRPDSIYQATHNVFDDTWSEIRRMCPAHAQRHLTDGTATHTTALYGEYAGKLWSKLDGPYGIPARVSFDVTERGKAVGFEHVTRTDVHGRTENGKWLLVWGHSDQHRVSARSLDSALKAFMVALGANGGTAEIEWEYNGRKKRVTVQPRTDRLEAHMPVGSRVININSEITGTVTGYYVSSADLLIIQTIAPQDGTAEAAADPAFMTPCTDDEWQIWEKYYAFSRDSAHAEALEENTRREAERLSGVTGDLSWGDESSRDIVLAAIRRDMLGWAFQGENGVWNMPLRVIEVEPGYLYPEESEQHRAQHGQPLTWAIDAQYDSRGARCLYGASANGAVSLLWS